MRRVHIDASTPYDVLIGDGLVDKCGELTAKVVAPCRVLLVTDDNVDELYADRAGISFRYAGFDVKKHVFPAGEASKNLRTLEGILTAMGEVPLTRTDLVAALGGGVTGDMAGFAAAIYARGMRFVQIPTTLLAAVDSSVGGKTAIDMPFGKNMVGAFHQPSLVVTDADVIRDLPADIFACGAAEAIKMGVLFDEALFARMESGDWRAQADDVIERCVQLKRDVVKEDEFDTGKRALLNLGHTFGHAIESRSGFAISHGQAVAIGTLMAAGAAGCPEAMRRRLARCFAANGLPTRCPFPAAELAKAALSDKKRAGGHITLVLPEAIGRCALKKVPVSELPAWFERALESQEALGL